MQIHDLDDAYFINVKIKSGSGFNTFLQFEFNNHFRFFFNNKNLQYISFYIYFEIKKTKKQNFNRLIRGKKEIKVCLVDLILILSSIEQNED